MMNIWLTSFQYVTFCIGPTASSGVWSVFITVAVVVIRRGWSFIRECSALRVCVTFSFTVGKNSFVAVTKLLESTVILPAPTLMSNKGCA